MSATPPRDFQALYASHGPLLRRILADLGVGPADLDDVAQETFVIVHRLLPSFEGRSSLETWLYAIARRVAANHRRRQRRAAGAGLAQPSVPEQEPDLSAEDLHATFSQMDGEHRDLLALHEVGGLSISSLSEMTGSARATIRQRLARGQAALGRALAGRASRTAKEAWLEAIAKRFEQPTEPLAERSLHVLPCRQTCLSALDDTVIAVWRGAASNESQHAVIAALVAHAHTRPQGIRYLSVIEKTSTPPTREGRAMMAWSAHKLGPKVKAAAAVAEGSALMSLVASVMNTSLVLARSPVNLRFFSDLTDTLSWLAQYGSLDAAATRELLERMRMSLDPPKTR